MRWLNPTWVLLACAGMGAVPAVIELVFHGMTAHRFTLSVFEGFVYATCIAVPCLVAMPRLAGVTSARPLSVRVGSAGALFGVFAVLGCFVANLILVVLGVVARGDFARTFRASLRVSVLITYTFGVLTVVIAMLQGRLARAKEELHTREMAEERERKIAAEARFASLESRVHPHFLFNTLNSISALIREDPREAELMVERLAALLRFSLDSELAGVVSLGEELRIVRDYLEIEKVRFGPRLRYRIESTDAADGLTVPALSVQTLVENSVKYAVGASHEGAEIVVDAQALDGRLQVGVSDDGPGFDPSTSHKPGHGLDLVRRRLANLFGASAALEIKVANGRTIVAIHVRQPFPPADGPRTDGPENGPET